MDYSIIVENNYTIFNRNVSYRPLLLIFNLFERFKIYNLFMKYKMKILYYYQKILLFSFHYSITDITSNKENIENNALKNSGKFSSKTVFAIVYLLCSLLHIKH